MLAYLVYPDKTQQPLGQVRFHAVALQRRRRYQPAVCNSVGELQHLLRAGHRLAHHAPNPVCADDQVRLVRSAISEMEYIRA
jgi:hypothetical protein